MAQSLAHFFAGILVGLAGAVLFFRPRTRKQATASLNSQLERLLRQLSEAEQQRSKNRSDIDELAKLLKGYQEDRQDLERAFNGIEQSFRAVRAMPMALRDGVGDLLRRHHDSILDEVRTSLQAIQAESGSGGDPRDLQALLEGEAALRAEAYRSSDAVTDIIGKMEECGDELVAELSH